MKKLMILSFAVLSVMVAVSACAGNGGGQVDRSVSYGYEGVYSVSEVNPNVYLINEMGQATCYLVLGTEKALLIDAGVGIGNLASLVKSLTRLPVMVVNTHGHLDHVGADFLFDDVWIHPLDTVLYNNFFRNPERIQTIKNFVSSDEAKTIGLNATEEDVNKVISIPPATIHLLNDGDVIDLGGRKLEVCALPGHTSGSIMFIDRSDKMLFSGDAIIGWLWLWLPESLPLKDYYARLKEVRPLLEGIDYIYSGHEQSVGVTTVAFADSVISHIGNVIAGNETSNRTMQYSTPVGIFEFDDFRLFLDAEQAAMYDKK